jgi:hypothetical protein
MGERARLAKKITVGSAVAAAKASGVRASAVAGRTAKWMGEMRAAWVKG